MSDLSLKIIQPANGTIFTGAAPIALQASTQGDFSGLFFKWFSSSNSAATADHPELKPPDDPAAILNWQAPLPEFGRHAIVVTASDQVGLDLASVQAVKRSAMAGGAPPAAPPCVVYRLVAQIRTPSANGQSLSKANATFEVLAPFNWIADPYSPIFALTFTAAGAPSPAISIPLTPSPVLPADTQTWFRWTGALPASLATGNYTLTVTAGGVAISDTRELTLTA